MDGVFIAGAAMTAFGKFPSSTLRSLSQDAVARVLEDAGLSADAVDVAFFANAAEGLMTGQESIRGQAALRDTGLLGIPITNVENACASASTAVHLAALTIAAGEADVAVAVGAEKLTHPDKARSFAAFDGALDLSAREPGDGGGDAARTRSPFMDVYAGLARDYAQRSGATPADFAAVAVKAHRHGALNPFAQYRDEVTAEEVLASRTVSDPLTLLMCSPIGDGAAAVVLASAAGLRRCAGAHSVRLLASVLRSGSADPSAPGAVVRAVGAAYARSGLVPEAVDVVELHDAAAPAELIVTEELGLCGPGEGPALLASGDTALGGRVPVNPSGGLLSKGHPVGATGIAQLVELCDQLRGRCGARQVPGARIALAENGGGWLGHDVAAATVTILAAA